MRRSDVSCSHQVRLNLPERSRQIHPLMETSNTRVRRPRRSLLFVVSCSNYLLRAGVCSVPIPRGAFADARLPVTSHRGAHRLPAQPLFQRVLFKPGINPLEYSTGNDASPLTGHPPPTAATITLIGDSLMLPHFYGVMPCKWWQKRAWIYLKSKMKWENKCDGERLKRVKGKTGFRF